MSSKDITTGRTSDMRSKKSRQAEKRSSLSRGASVLDPEKMGEARFDPAALFGVGDVLLDGDVKLAGGRRRILAFDDACPAPHHLG